MQLFISACTILGVGINIPGFVLGNGPAPRRASLKNGERPTLLRGGSLRQYWIEKVNCGSPKLSGSPRPTMDENGQEQEDQYPPPSYEVALRRMIDDPQPPDLALPIEPTLPGTPIYRSAEEERTNFFSQQVVGVAMSIAPPTVAERTANTSHD